jgi:hypothetical protein
MLRHRKLINSLEKVSDDVTRGVFFGFIRFVVFVCPVQPSVCVRRACPFSTESAAFPPHASHVSDNIVLYALVDLLRAQVVTMEASRAFHVQLNQHVRVFQHCNRTRCRVALHRYSFHMQHNTSKSTRMDNHRRQQEKASQLQRRVLDARGHQVRS